MPWVLLSVVVLVVLVVQVVPGLMPRCSVMAVLAVMPGLVGPAVSAVMGGATVAMPPVVVPVVLVAGRARPVLVPWVRLGRRCLVLVVSAAPVVPVVRVVPVVPVARAVPRPVW